MACTSWCTGMYAHKTAIINEINIQPSPSHNQNIHLSSETNANPNDFYHPFSPHLFHSERTLIWKTEFLCKYEPMSFLAKIEKKFCVYSVVSISLSLLFLCKFSQDIQVICLETPAIQQRKGWENNEKCAGRIHIKALETWKWKQQILRNFFFFFWCNRSKEKLSLQCEFV